jgi:hypothetical protein
MSSDILQLALRPDANCAKAPPQLCDSMQALSRDPSITFRSELSGGLPCVALSHVAVGAKALPQVVPQHADIEP